MTWTRKAAIVLAATFVLTDFGLEWSPQSPAKIEVSLGTPAQARIGRPLTPLSYAGVARRTTRRAVYGAPVAAGIAVLPAGCVYGRYGGAYYYKCGGLYYARRGGVYVQVNVY